MKSTSKGCALAILMLSSGFCVASALPKPCAQTLAIGSVTKQPAGRLLMFGEMHGTREAPQLIADLSCGLLRNREERVWVLLEYPTSDNAHLQRYMASQGTATDRETLLASRFWQPEHQDGRRSRAMLDMLESLRALAVQTGRLRVEAFDPGFDDAEKRDALMAQQVERLVAESKGAQILLLTGNIHNRKKPGVDWDKELVTMGSLIKRPYRSYLLRANRGAYWGRDQNGAGVKSLPTLASNVINLRKNTLNII